MKKLKRNRPGEESPAVAGLVAAVLAGGPGTRLRSVVSDLPKALARINDTPFLFYLLDYLVKHGIRNVVLCTGYRAEAIEKTVGAKWGPIQVKYSTETIPLGTAGALRLAAPLLQSDPVLVTNGDSYCDIDLNAFYRAHRERRARASIALCKVPDISRYGRVELRRNGEVARFCEKEGKAAPGWINAGLYLIDKKLLEKIPTRQFSMLETNFFPNWLGNRFFGYRSASARFIDIGTPESYRFASQFFRRRRVESLTGINT